MLECGIELVAPSTTNRGGGPDTARLSPAATRRAGLSATAPLTSTRDAAINSAAWARLSASPRRTSSPSTRRRAATAVRQAQLVALAFFAVAFFAVAFFAVAFFAVAFFAVAFLAVDFLAAAFFAGAFLATDFFLALTTFAASLLPASAAGKETAARREVADHAFELLLDWPIRSASSSSCLLTSLLIAWAIIADVSRPRSMRPSTVFAASARPTSPRLTSSLTTFSACLRCISVNCRPESIKFWSGFVGIAAMLPRRESRRDSNASAIAGEVDSVKVWRRVDGGSRRSITGAHEGEAAPERLGEAAVGGQHVADDDEASTQLLVIVAVSAEQTSTAVTIGG